MHRQARAASAALALVLATLLAGSAAQAQPGGGGGFPGGGGGMGGMGGMGPNGGGEGKGSKHENLCDNVPAAPRDGPPFFMVFARELRQRQPALHLAPEVQAQFVDFVELVEEVGQHDDRLAGRISGKARGSVSAAQPVGNEIRARREEADDQQHALDELDKRWQSLSHALDDDGNARVLDAFNAARTEIQAAGKS